MDVAVLLFRDKTSWPRLDGYNTQYTGLLLLENTLQLKTVVIGRFTLTPSILRGDEKQPKHYIIHGMCWNGNCITRAHTHTQMCVCVIKC